MSNIGMQGPTSRLGPGWSEIGLLTGEGRSPVPDDGRRTRSGALRDDGEVALQIGHCGNPGDVGWKPCEELRLAHAERWSRLDIHTPQRLKVVVHEDDLPPVGRPPGH